MARKNLGEKIKLTSYEDLFKTADDYESAEGQIKEVSLSELHPFKNHPFKVVDDESMEEMVESVKEYGILVPGIVRELEEGGYELISGHRRKHAAELAGLNSMPVIVRNCSDDEATLVMVDANIQRENVSISEKAKAYRMKYEAMKHQGSAGGCSLDEISEATGESRRTIQRLIQLSYLSDAFLALIDAKKLGIVQGVDISYIPSEQRDIVLKVMNELGIIVNMEQSARIKNASKDGLFSEEWLREILNYKKPVVRKVVFNQSRLDSYFEPSMSNEDIEGVIVQLLEEWKANGGKM